MQKVIGTSYPYAKYVLNAGDLAGSGAAASGAVAGYVKLDTLPPGAVIHWTDWKVDTAAAGVTTITGRLVTADTGTTNNQVNYGAATDATTTATDVQVSTITQESRIIGRDLLFRVALATGTEVATSVTAGQISVWVNYSVKGS
jgi:hypothetical protein